MTTKSASVIILEGLADNEYIEETEPIKTYPLKKLRRIENSLNNAIEEITDENDFDYEEMEAYKSALRARRKTL